MPTQQAQHQRANRDLAGCSRVPFGSQHLCAVCSLRQCCAHILCTTNVIYKHAYIAYIKIGNCYVDLMSQRVCFPTSVDYDLLSAVCCVALLHRCDAVRLQLRRDRKRNAPAALACGAQHNENVLLFLLLQREALIWASQMHSFVANERARARDEMLSERARTQKRKRSHMLRSSCRLAYAG